MKYDMRTFFLFCIFVFTSLIGSSLVYAQPKLQQISKPGLSLSEPTIVLNPLNPLHLVAATNSAQVFVSIDGGTSWTQSTLTSTFGVRADPTLAFDGVGNLFYAHLSGKKGDSNHLDRIVVQRSTDGGNTWNNGAGIGYLGGPHKHDKEWITCDRVNGRLYVVWTEFIASNDEPGYDSSRIVLSYSSDNGNTWSEMNPVSDGVNHGYHADLLIGAMPTSGTNGEVYIAWVDSIGLWFDKSADGGMSFGTDKLLNTQIGMVNYYPPYRGKCHGFPFVLCDHSNSMTRGNLYVVWADTSHGSDNIDVFFIRSTDGGATWSQRRKINSDSKKTDQFVPAATIDEATGDLHIVFYDTRFGDGIKSDIVLASSTDGGSTFVETRLSATSFFVGSFPGDYIGITAFNRKVHPIWAQEGSQGEEMIWTTSFKFEPKQGRVFGQEQGITNSLAMFPNPVVSELNISSQPFSIIRIIDILGREVDRVIMPPNTTSYTLDIRRYPAGAYYVRIASKTSRFVKM